jgi:hypothetical protein
MAYGFLCCSSLIDVESLSIRCDEGFVLDSEKKKKRHGKTLLTSTMFLTPSRGISHRLSGNFEVARLQFHSETEEKVMAKRPISQFTYFFCVIPPCGEDCLSIRRFDLELFTFYERYAVNR